MARGSEERTKVAKETVDGGRRWDGNKMNTRHAHDSESPESFAGQGLVGVMATYASNYTAYRLIDSRGTERQS